MGKLICSALLVISFASIASIASSSQQHAPRVENPSDALADLAGVAGHVHTHQGLPRDAQGQATHGFGDVDGLTGAGHVFPAGELYSI